MEIDKEDESKPYKNGKLLLDIGNITKYTNSNLMWNFTDLFLTYILELIGCPS